MGGKINVGDTFENTKGVYFTIIESLGKAKYRVRFTSGSESCVNYTNILRGAVKDLNYKSVRGVACIGYGKYTDTQAVSYIKWQSMLKRCYSTLNKASFYKGVTVCEDWLNYQNFAAWMENTYVDGWELDKDLLGDGTLYSKDNCCFLPKSLNIFLREVNGTECSGVRGINNKSGVRYSARINKEGGRIILGTFDSFEEAKQVRDLAKNDWLDTLINQYKNNLTSEVITALNKMKI